jgi:hypothetical protein
MRIVLDGLETHIHSPKENKGCVTLWPLPFTLKSILRQKNNYENSNISPCKNIMFQNPLKESKILQDIIILQLIIPSFNTSQNIMFQKSSYKNSPYDKGAYKNPLSYYTL